MQINNLDEEYLNIVKDILNNDKFNELKACQHHGMTRYEHSVKVSYNAYKYAKKHNLDYKAVAVGGLLHDFFITKNVNKREKFISTFTHPKKARINAINEFKVNYKEENIIVSHMFPIGGYTPKYKESWIVNLVDKKIGLKEFASEYAYKFRYAANLTLVLLLNFIK